MDKQLSAKEETKLSNALGQTKEPRKKTVEKETDKRWSDISIPFTLAEYFNTLTKNELSEIRAQWDIKGISSLKKQELAAVLAEKIPALLALQVHQWDETRYKIFKHLADRGGLAMMPLELHQLDYFKNRGLIYSGTYQGKRTLVIPKEIMASYKQLDSSQIQESVRSNTELIQLTQGLLHYYGVLSTDEWSAMIERHTGVKPLYYQSHSVLMEAAHFHLQLYFTSKGLAYGKVRAAEQLHAEHEARKDLPYCPFTKAQLLQAGEPDFVDRNPSYQSFITFLRKTFTISPEEADHLVEQCVYGIRLGHSPNDLFKFLQSVLQINELDLVKSFMSHIITLHNNTKQWSIKGYAPSELSASKNGETAPKADVINFSTGKKVGRNDPCPCGSGKKFKKCCGM
ncbi:YecA family protein [Paenibacillus sp. NPDC056579]|uniref:YecA family protein n=1 Tax=Paenibacillus sp. NPDC056579 TaxID=3345871 RepID=UPI0036943CAE